MKINGNLSIVKLFPGILQQQFIAGLLHTAILVVKVKHTREWKLSHRKQKKNETESASYLLQDTSKKYDFKERFLPVASDGFIY